MDLLILLGVVIFLMIAVPIGLSYLIYRWIAKRTVNKKYRLLAFIPILIVGYFVYNAIYPDSDFYKEDFKEVTDIEFPSNATITDKSASYPDQFGDYSSSFLAEFDEDFIKQLEQSLNNNGFVKTEDIMHTNELQYIEERKGSRKYMVKYSKVGTGKFFSVGFLDDNKSIIVTRTSW